MTLDQKRAAGTDGLVIVLTTVDDRDVARGLGRRLVEAGVAACVQIDAVASIYRWQDGIAEDEELRLMIKTPALRLDAAVATLVEHHPYEVPQILVLEAAAERPYLDWAREVTSTG